jgi:hypothetical protein
MPCVTGPEQHMNLPRIIGYTVLAILGFLPTGCSSSQPSPTASKIFKSKGGHDHEHHRADAMLEDITLPDGTKCHAGLSAHLDPKGNELDIFFESLEQEPKPVSIPLSAQVTARITREGDDKPYNLTFQPAPAEERPKDPAGRCSRFSAPAAWMKEDDKLTVVVTVEYEGQLKRVTFADFVPRKHAHRHESGPSSENTSTNKETKKP